MSARRSGVVAVVPMKPLSRSKTRLAGVLSGRERADLSLAMFAKVIGAAREAVGAVWVVGGDDAARCAAERLGAVWKKDHGKDLNDSLSIMFDEACENDMSPIYLPADLPFVTADDIAKVVRASGAGETLTLSPAQQDGGTNAMLVPKCVPFPPALGEDSFKRHKRQAASLGIPFVVCLSEGLGLDLDTPEDLSLCDKLQPGFSSKIMPIAAAVYSRGDEKDL